jgi:DNA-binding transcriptional MerR regulator
MAAEGRVRIGELARRTGVTVELLRAWEKRYGLLQPARTPSGYRLYSDADERRVREMQKGLDAGLAAAEAARAAVATAVPDGVVDVGAAASELRGALERFDDAAAHLALDSLLSGFTFETVGRDVVLPLLREIGDRWHRGELTVAQEHFASSLLRGRLLGLARGWDQGVGPRALLACPPGERHELGLIVFGIALRAQGWRITYLGADTPIESIDSGAADVVVIAATGRKRFEAAAEDLRALARSCDVAIGGTGAAPELAERIGARLLPADPFQAATRLGGTPSVERVG